MNATGFSAARLNFTILKPKTQMLTCENYCLAAKLTQRFVAKLQRIGKKLLVTKKNCNTKIYVFIFDSLNHQHYVNNGYLRFVGTQPILPPTILETIHICGYMPLDTPYRVGNCCWRSSYIDVPLIQAISECLESNLRKY